MKNIVREMNNRALRRFLDGTSFCDEGGEVCTPACRRDSLRRRAEQSVYRSGFPRF
jgi:hypothetical protein